MSGGLSGARSSPGGVGAEVQPLADPREAPGAKRDVCDPHREAQAEPDLVPWPPCPAPTTWVPGAQVSSLMVLGGISQPSRAWLHGPQPPRPAPCGLSCCPRRPSYFPPGRTGPEAQPYPGWRPLPPHQAVPGPASPSSPHVLHDILLPRQPLRWLLLQAAFLGPLPVPWALHTVGVLGRGQSRTPSGPHGCSQQAWGGQMWWLWEPPPWGRGGLTCELGPQS